jgi:hypothetical protein
LILPRACAIFCVPCRADSAGIRGTFSGTNPHASVAGD